MRPILDMETVQIELTNACMRSCANCTRFCGHHYKPYMMDFETFKTALDSLQDFPKMTGFMGGEPLLHPEFEKFCDYALTKIPRERLGLWSGFPKGNEKYREVICRTFGNVFLNDHARPDINHAPILVAADEIMANKQDMWLIIEKCWVQACWSASINPKGAFFCEIAAAMSILFEGPHGWKVEPYWWKRIPKDFVSQMEQWCPKCGCAFPLARRSSNDLVDDVSPGNVKKLKMLGRSKRIDQGKYVLSDFSLYKDPAPMAAYKNETFRKNIADRYGIFLTVNAKGYNEPHLNESFQKHRTFFEVMQEL